MPLFLRASLPIVLLAALPCHAQEMNTNGQWPLRFMSGKDQVQVFAPQPERMEGDHFTARFAVSIKRAEDAAPVFGAVWGEGLMVVDRSTRLGTLQRLEVSDVHFPQPLSAEADRIGAMLSREIPLRAKPFAIDWLVASLENEQVEEVSYWNDAPEIIYTEKPTVLVYVDGEPEYLRLERPSDYADPLYNGISTDVERVLNTPYLLLRYRKNAHYLYGSGRWFRATALKGPYALASDVPEPLKELAAAVDTAGAEVVPDARVPEVLVRTTSAALLDLDGPPQMKPIQSTGLLNATNTDKDLFLEIATQQYYLLASGRWYATADPRSGSWRHVPPDALPVDFARIPEGSAKDGVLAHVAGTTAAREAVRDTYIPQTATVDRNTATLEVKYDGAPRFERIDGTDVDLAVNANTTVLRIQGHYHACHNAVWFDSNTPEGPWVVSTVVPAMVENIPPSSPAYNTRYVDIYDVTENEVVTGYTPGYLGTYVQSGVVVMGTGYYYPFWPGYWYPRPFTWGFNMYYDPWMGWSLGMGWGWNWFYPGWMYGPWGPWYGWGPWGWWGPWSYCPPWMGTPRPAYYGHRPSIMDGSPRAPTARPVDLYSIERRAGVKPTVLERTPVVQGGAQPTNDRAPAPPPTTKPDTRDHYTDPNGNVFRRDGTRIQRYQDGTWRTMPSRPAPARPPTVPYDIQQRRDRGEQRVRDHRYYQQRSMPSRPTPAPAPSAPRTSPAPRQNRR